MYSENVLSNRTKKKRNWSFFVSKAIGCDLVKTIQKCAISFLHYDNTSAHGRFYLWYRLIFNDIDELKHATNTIVSRIGTCNCGYFYMLLVAKGMSKVYTCSWWGIRRETGIICIAVIYNVELLTAELCIFWQKNNTAVLIVGFFIFAREFFLLNIITHILTRHTSLLNKRKRNYKYTNLMGSSVICTYIRY